MKVLYLLICYKNFDIVNRIICELDSPRSEFIIHIDKDSKEDINKISLKENIHLVSNRLSTPWGGPELAIAVLDGVKEAYKFEWDYVCLLSESDYPVKSPHYIADYLHLSNKDHILINTLPCDNPLETPGGHWLEGGRRRIECYALRLNSKNIATIEPKKLNWGNFRQLIKIFRYSPIKILTAIRMLLFYPKRNFNIQPCGGHQWFILKRETVKSIIKYVDLNPSFLEDCKNTQCLDEIFFPTLVNHIVTDKSTISRDILRYISWDNTGNASPRDLSLNDTSVIENCINDANMLFLRKVGNKEVCDLIDRLKNK